MVTIGDNYAKTLRNEKKEENKEEKK